MYIYIVVKHFYHYFLSHNDTRLTDIIAVIVITFFFQYAMLIIVAQDYDY